MNKPVIRMNQYYSHIVKINFYSSAKPKNMLASIYRLSLERKRHAEALQDLPGLTLEQEFQDFFLGAPTFLGSSRWIDAIISYTRRLVLILMFEKGNLPAFGLGS